MSLPATDDRLDAVFQALSSGTRRAMIRRLAEGPANVTDLVPPGLISKPAVSRHVRVLEDAGLLRRARDGRLHRCSLDSEGLDQARVFLEETRAFWEGNLDALEAFLENDDG
jgi:DNA-binding transcriptional ArsR family regulator